MMKAWQHFKTITTHKIWVMRYCFKIGLYWQGLTHDLSKYSPTEFLVGMKYYQGDRSPNNAEREGAVPVSQKRNRPPLVRPSRDTLAARISAAHALGTRRRRYPLLHPLPLSKR